MPRLSTGIHSIAMVSLVFAAACQSQGLRETPDGTVINGECVPPATGRVALARMAASAPPFSSTERNLATQLVAIFEGGTVDLQYDYAEEHPDGRGFTVGTVGFTTGTGDALAVVRTYGDAVARRADATPLSRENVARLTAYLSELERLDRLPVDDPRRADTSRLVGFDQAWRDAARDPIFRTAQDAISDDLYYVPAARYAAGVGLKTALSRAALLDAIIQHGGGEDPDGLPALLGLAREERGTPSTRDEEVAWLRRFLEIRAQDLVCPHNETTQEVWKESVDRVSVYLQLLEAGNLQLTPPLLFDLYGHGWEVRIR